MIVDGGSWLTINKHELLAVVVDEDWLLMMVSDNGWLWLLMVNDCELLVITI